MPLRAIVFDFDGVIANSEPLHCRAFQDVMAAEGIPLATEEYYARYLGYDDVGAFRAMAVDHGRELNIDEVAALVDRKALRLEALEREVSVLYEGAEAAIRSAAAAMPIAIASGALKAEIVRVLDRAGLTALFTAIVAAEDTPACKPAPDPYLRAVDLLARRVPGLSTGDCLAIEDSRWGLDAARAAGLRTVAVTTSYRADELEADVVIPGLHALDLAILRRLW